MSTASSFFADQLGLKVEINRNKDLPLFFIQLPIAQQLATMEQYTEQVEGQRVKVAHNLRIFKNEYDHDNLVPRRLTYVDETDAPEIYQPHAIPVMFTTMNAEYLLHPTLDEIMAAGRKRVAQSSQLVNQNKRKFDWDGQRTDKKVKVKTEPNVPEPLAIVKPAAKRSTVAVVDLTVSLSGKHKRDEHRERSFTSARTKFQNAQSVWCRLPR